MNEFDHTDLACCSFCGCLVLAIYTVQGHTILWDPCFRDRRMIVSQLGITTWAEWLEEGQGWGLCHSQPHECPPAEYAPLDRIRARKEAADAHLWN